MSLRGEGGTFRALFAECRSAYHAHLARIHPPTLDTATHIAIVITRPPESIAVMLPVAADRGDVVALVDSHSRPHLNLSGAYLVTSTDEQQIIDRLDTLYPSCGEGGVGGLMEEMYNTVEGTVLCLNV